MKADCEKNKIGICLLGLGNVGREILSQLATGSLEIELKALANSKKWLIWRPHWKMSDWQDLFNTHAQDYHISELAGLSSDTVVVDATDSAEVAGQYEKWFAHGLHIVAANKIANSGPDYKKVMVAKNQYHRQYHYETTVGAALPILHTSRYLKATNDTLLEVNAVLSGTMSATLNALSENNKLSEVLYELYQKGHTEPDPRIDLSGLDVARKLVIMARELGIDLTLSQVRRPNLYPAQWDQLPLAEFFERLKSLDGPMELRRQQASLAGNKLCFVAGLKANAQAWVDIVPVTMGSALANLKGPDNWVSFKTHRYDDNPLVIQGPGAGVEVTASGVICDILKISPSFHL